MEPGNLTIEIPISKIYANADFNCRGAISPHDVRDLAEDIKVHGLLQPVVVAEVSGADLDALKSKFPGTEYQYLLVAGYRRVMAYRVLNIAAIPAVIRTGLSAEQIVMMNLSENMVRKQLNLVQEAKSVKMLVDLGLTQKQIATSLNTNQSWVSIRIALLKLEPEIQNEAAKGYLTQQHITRIAQLETAEQRFELLRLIKTRLQNGEKNIKIENQKKKPSSFKARPRSKDEITNMILHLSETFGYSLTTRLLGWASGEVTDFQIYTEIKEECDKVNKLYVMPQLHP